APAAQRRAARVGPHQTHGRIDGPRSHAGLAADLDADAAVAGSPEIDRPLRRAAAGIDDEAVLRQVGEEHVVDQLVPALFVAADLPARLAPLDRAQRLPEIDLVRHGQGFAGTSPGLTRSRASRVSGRTA